MLNGRPPYLSMEDIRTAIDRLANALKKSQSETVLLNGGPRHGELREVTSGCKELTLSDPTGQEIYRRIPGEMNENPMPIFVYQGSKYYVTD